MKYKKIIITSLVSLFVIGLGISSYYGYKGYLSNEENKSKEKALEDLKYTKEVLKNKFKDENILRFENVKNEDKNSKMVRNYTFNLYYYEFSTKNCMEYDFTIDKISVYKESWYDLYKWELPSWDYILKSTFEELKDLEGYFIIDNHAYDVGAIMRIRYYTSDFKGKAIWDIGSDEIDLYESSFNEPSNNISIHEEPIFYPD